MAVDYIKTGQPARLTRDLQPLKWPHFMEKVGKKQHQIYRSKKVLGQLYDQVERIDFVPAFTAPFDTRILHAYTLNEDILRSAREIKEEYDAHMRRIMAQQEIKTEFEVWSTFVLQHSSTSNTFKYHEQIGEISMALKDQFRLICHERAGGKDYEHIGPFAAAMYEVTAREVTAAVEECHGVQMVGGQSRPLREMTPSAMPLMSFPWLFQDILGKIAKSNISKALGTLSIRGEIGSKAADPPDEIKVPQPKRGRVGPRMLDPDDYLETSKGTTHPGELLELFGRSGEFCERKGPAKAKYIPSTSSSNSSMGMSVERSSSANDGSIDHSSSSSPERLARKTQEECSNNAEVSMENNSKSTTSSVSHLRGSGSPLYSQRRIEVAELAGKEQTAVPIEAFLKGIHGDDKDRSIEHDYTIPEGSNLRLLNELMMDLSVRSDQPNNLILKSTHSEERNVLEDVSLAEEKPAITSHLSKIDVSDKVKNDEGKEIITEEEEEKDHGVNDNNDYTSDSDAESVEVVLSIDTKARLLDQLATIAGDDSASRANAIDDLPIAIQESTDQKLDCSKSDLVPVSLMLGSQSQEGQ